MNVIMFFYYLIAAFLLGLLAWNFLRERRNGDDLALYLLVMIPLLLRLLRVK